MDGLHPALDPAPLREATRRLLALGPEARQAGAAPFLRAFALTLGTDAHLRAAELDPARAGLAAVMIRAVLPEAAALLAET